MVFFVTLFALAAPESDARVRTLTVDSRLKSEPIPRSAPPIAKRDGDVADGPCSANREEKIHTDLLRAAEVLAARSVEERAVHWDAIFKVLTFVKIGNRGVLRFEVENPTRHRSITGVRL